MQECLNEMLHAFDTVAQPVFFAQAGQIVFVNPAARRLGVGAGEALAPLLADTADVDPAHDTALLPLRLPTGPVDAVVRPLGEGSIYLLQPHNTPDGDFLPALQSIARTLRVPLSNLFGAANAIFPQLEALEDPAVSHQMASINRALYQLMHLCCNLGDVAASWQGQMRLAREKTELCTFIGELCARTEPLCASAGAALTCELPVKLFNAWIDRQKIERCILNLISNAMRHSSDAPSILVRLVKSGRSALVQVSCGQSGFAVGELAEAFTRFATQEPLPSPSWGAGFGLPLVRQIVQLHGGVLMLRDTPEGGTAAVFSIPLDAPETPQVHSPTAEIDYAGGFHHALVELADVLPLEVFDSENVN